MRSVPYYNLNGRLGPRDAAPPRSVAGSLRHRSRCNRRSVERAVDVLKSGALGFGAEHPETDQAEAGVLSRAQSNPRLVAFDPGGDSGLSLVERGR